MAHVYGIDRKLGLGMGFDDSLVGVDCDVSNCANYNHGRRVLVEATRTLIPQIE